MSKTTFMLFLNTIMDADFCNNQMPELREAMTIECLERCMANPGYWEGEVRKRKRALRERKGVTVWK